MKEEIDRQAELMTTVLSWAVALAAVLAMAWMLHWTITSVDSLVASFQSISISVAKIARTCQ